MSLSPHCRDSGTPKATNDQGASWRWASGLPPFCQWGLLSSASLEDCLTPEEWFELAHDAEIHCREHWGCL